MNRTSISLYVIWLVNYPKWIAHINYSFTLHNNSIINLNVRADYFVDSRYLLLVFSWSTGTVVIRCRMKNWCACKVTGSLLFISYSVICCCKFIILSAAGWWFFKVIRRVRQAIQDFYVDYERSLKCIRTIDLFALVWLCYSSVGLHLNLKCSWSNRIRDKCHYDINR